MPTPCTHTKPNGQPCRADALPDSPLCLFHDPRHQDTLAQARSKGGAAPRRRSRRLPPILDHLHVAQLLSELLVEAVNETDPANPRQLQAVTALSRALLKAVGVPATFALHGDRSEPPPTTDHLLRRYRPQPAEEEAIPDGSAATETGTSPPEEPDSAPTVAAMPILQVTSLRAYHAGVSLLSFPARSGSTAPTITEETHPGPPAGSLPPSPLTTTPASPLPNPVSPAGSSAPLTAAPSSAEVAPQQEAEQGMNRAWTGLPATEHFPDASDIAERHTASLSAKSVAGVNGPFPVASPSPLQRMSYPVDGGFSPRHAAQQPASAALSTSPETLEPDDDLHPPTPADPAADDAPANDPAEPPAATLSTAPADDDGILWWPSRHPPPGRRAGRLLLALGNTRRRPWVDPFW